MGKTVEVKLVETQETIISIQNADATLLDHLIKIDAEKLENYRQIQRDFVKMQNELQELINKE